MTAQASPGRFAALATIGASYRLVLTHLGDFVRIAWAWIAIAYAIGYAGAYLAVHTGESFLAVLGAVAVTVGASAFAVKWHRRALLGATAVGMPLALGRRDAVFIGRALLIVLAAFAPVALAFALGAALVFSNDETLIAIAIAVCVVLVLAALFLLIRFALILPAAAVDDAAFGWRRAWAATAGVSLRLWGGALLTVVPVAVLSKLVENLAIFAVYQFGALPLALALGIFSTVLVFLDVAIAATYTSLAYRALVSRSG